MGWHLSCSEHRLSRHREVVIQRIYDDLYQQQWLTLKDEITSRIYIEVVVNYTGIFRCWTGGALTSAPRSSRTRPTST